MTALAPRQMDCASLAADGLTNKQIARELGLSPRMVKKHVEGAMHRLSVSRRGGLARGLAGLGQ